MTIAQIQFQQDLLTWFSYAEATINAISSSEPSSEADKNARKEYIWLYKQYCRDNNLNL